MALLVLTVTTRICPSGPGWVSSILPSAHFAGGRLSSNTSTISPMFMAGHAVCHFLRCCNVCRYSDDHCFQNRCTICCVFCHLVNNWGLASRRIGCTKAVVGSPIKNRLSWDRVVESSSTPLLAPRMLKFLRRATSSHR